MFRLFPFSSSAFFDNYFVLLVIFVSLLFTSDGFLAFFLCIWIRVCLIFFVSVYQCLISLRVFVYARNPLCILI